MSRSV